MKKLEILSFMVLSLLWLSCSGKAQDKQVNDQNLINKIEVIDFHSTHRCMTCNAIEANTKYTLNTFFPEEREKGLIDLKIVNVDEKENYQLAEKFEASGTSLYLNVIVDRKETVINLTDFAFMKGTDKEAFSSELKLMLEKELKKL